MFLVKLAPWYSGAQRCPLGESERGPKCQLRMRADACWYMPVSGSSREFKIPSDTLFSQLTALSQFRALFSPSRVPKS